MWYPVEKNKFCVIKAIDRSTRKTPAWMLGNHDAAPL